jgi:SAM-dependent methyltransferase
MNIGQQWATILQEQGYPQIDSRAFLNRFSNSPYIELIRRHVRLMPNSSILEAGCGSGKFSLALSAIELHRVTTLDYSHRVLRDMQATAAHILPETEHPPIGYPLGDLARLPFPDNHFDLILNEGVIEHWLDRNERLAILREMRRVVKPGGAMVVFVPNGVHPLEKQWAQHVYPDAPPMTFYDASRLKDDLRSIGLAGIKTDGVYPWRSWTRLGMWRKLYKPSAALDNLMPTPRSLRQRWGSNLFAVGFKPA